MTELNQGIGHLRQAAAYAAKGAGTRVGPRVQAARGAVVPTAIMVRDRASSGLASTVAALTPLVLAIRDAQAEATGRSAAGRKAAAKQAAASRKAKAKNLRAARKKQKRHSAGRMAGLLAAGTVAGLAGAMAMRRRREQQEWAEYDVASRLAPMHEDVDTIVVETPDPSAKVTQATGAGNSAVAGGGSAATATSGSQPVIKPTDQVPAVAEGARDTSGRPAADVSKALNNGKNTAKTTGRR